MARRPPRGAGARRARRRAPSRADALPRRAGALLSRSGTTHSPPQGDGAWSCGSRPTSTTSCRSCRSSPGSARSRCRRARDPGVHRRVPRDRAVRRARGADRGAARHVDARGRSRRTRSSSRPPLGGVPRSRAVGPARHRGARSPGLRFLGEAFDRLGREYPSTRDGLSLTERRLLAAVQEGADTPPAAFARGAAREIRPFLGDTWAFDRLAAMAAGPAPLLTAEPLRAHRRGPRRAGGRGRPRRAQRDRPLDRRRAPARSRGAVALGRGAGGGQPCSRGAIVRPAPLSCSQ